jgi:hypothetical protein
VINVKQSSAGSEQVSIGIRYGGRTALVHVLVCNGGGSEVEWVTTCLGTIQFSAKRCSVSVACPELSRTAQLQKVRAQIIDGRLRDAYATRREAKTSCNAD